MSKAEEVARSGHCPRVRCGRLERPSVVLNKMWQAESSADWVWPKAGVKVVAMVLHQTSLETAFRMSSGAPGDSGIYRSGERVRRRHVDRTREIECGVPTTMMVSVRGSIKLMLRFDPTYPRQQRRMLSVVYHGATFFTQKPTSTGYTAHTDNTPRRYTTPIFKQSP